MIADLIELAGGPFQVADVGAAFFGEAPPYQPLMDQGLCRLYAFEPDVREVGALREHLGASATVLPFALGDGLEHDLYVCPKGLGMSSLHEPDPTTLGFFNLFPEWGRVESIERIATRRLDDVSEVPSIDFLKMDVQGSELSILTHGRKKLARCVALQTEISFITLYKNQPAFGEIDQELRRQGLIPHRFTNVKCWSISPTIRAGQPRYPFNQLLEGDIVYIRDIIHPEGMDDSQIAKLAVIAHSVYQSPDLAARCVLELQRRKVVDSGTLVKYYELLAQPA